MKDAENMPLEKNIRYMSIDGKEYQNRKQALPEIKDIVRKK